MDFIFNLIEHIGNLVDNIVLTIVSLIEIMISQIGIGTFLLYVFNECIPFELSNIFAFVLVSVIFFGFIRHFKN